MINETKEVILNGTTYIGNFNNKEPMLLVGNNFDNIKKVLNVNGDSIFNGNLLINGWSWSYTDIIFSSLIFTLIVNLWIAVYFLNNKIEELKSKNI